MPKDMKCRRCNAIASDSYIGEVTTDKPAPKPRGQSGRCLNGGLNVSSDCWEVGCGQQRAARA